MFRRVWRLIHVVVLLGLSFAAALAGLAGIIVSVPGLTSRQYFYSSEHLTYHFFDQYFKVEATPEFYCETAVEIRGYKWTKSVRNQSTGPDRGRAFGDLNFDVHYPGKADQKASQWSVSLGVFSFGTYCLGYPECRGRSEVRPDDPYPWPASTVGFGGTVPAWFPGPALAAYPLWVLVRGPVRRWRRRRNGLCETCAYNLTGNVTGVCPECGSRL